MVSLSQDKLLIHALGIGVVRMVALSCFARHPPDPRPLVFPRRRCHAVDCGSFQMRQQSMDDQFMLQLRIFNDAANFPNISVFSVHA